MVKKNHYQNFISEKIVVNTALNVRNVSADYQRYEKQGGHKKHMIEPLKNSMVDVPYVVKNLVARDILG
nr:MAG: hypothetical protein [Bacteriophage sp.]